MKSIFLAGFLATLGPDNAAQPQQAAPTVPSDVAPTQPETGAVPTQPPMPTPGPVDAQGTRQVDIAFYENALLPFHIDVSSNLDDPSPIRMTAFPADKGFQQRVRRVLAAELARYPSGTIDRLDQIIVGGELTYKGEAGLGAYFLSMIWIAAGTHDTGPDSDADVARILHHEISSILYWQRATAFNEAAFRAALPEEFVYWHEQTKPSGPELAAPVSHETPSELLDRGFLVPWAQRNLEQDFNSYAQTLMTRPHWLLETFDPDSRVGRKARVVRDFYLALDPRFEAMIARCTPAPR